MTTILRQRDISDEDWQRVSASLAGGGLAALPSDTVYGLAALATVPAAVERLYQVKGRRREKPVALVFTSVGQIASLIRELPEALKAALARLLPGPVTAVVPFEEGSGGIFVYGGGSVGVRIIPPPEGDIYSLLPGPLAVTSANLSGQPDPAGFGDIPADVLSPCEFAVDGDQALTGLDEAYSRRLPSTVVDLRPLIAGGPVVILRQGAMTREEIEKRLG